MDIVWHGVTHKNLPGYIMLALDEIHKTYGHIVQPKGKSLLKFGQADALGTDQDTIWVRGGNETYVNDNLITHFSSDNSGDGQSLVVEGHTIDADGDFTFVEQTVTLQGQSKEALTIPLARSSRFFNNGSIPFSGTIYVYEDDTVTLGVPQTLAKIHLTNDGICNQSLKAATTISKDDYWLITSVYGGVTKKTSAIVDFNYEVREKGKTFRARFLGTAASQGPAVSLPLNPCLIVPPNADFRIRGEGTTTNIGCAAWANGILCGIIR